MGELNNRELATLIWFGAVFLILTWKANAWGLVRGLVSTFCKPIILRSLALMAAYVAGCVWILARFDLWRLDNLKTTIMWFGAFVLGWLFNFKRWEADPDAQVSATVKELLNVTILVTFLAEFYTFSLVGELVLVPVLSIIALLAAVAQGKPEMAAAAKLFNGLLALAGWGLLLFAAGRLIADFRTFATPDTGREFALPGLLSLMFLPFMYAFNVFAAYDVGLRTLPTNIEKAGLRGYALRSAVLSFGTNVKLMRRWKKALFVLGAKTAADINAVIATLRAAEARERKPPLVPQGQGWSPHAAREWLRDHALVAGDYSPRYGGWGATSQARRLQESVLGDTLSYSIAGTAMAATRLTLVLDRGRLENGPTSDASLQALVSATTTLLTAVFGEDAERVVKSLRCKKRRVRFGVVLAQLVEDEDRLKLTLTHEAHVEAV
jgi:hypothetical protein